MLKGRRRGTPGFGRPAPVMPEGSRGQIGCGDAEAWVTPIGSSTVQSEVTNDGAAASGELRRAYLSLACGSVLLMLAMPPPPLASMRIISSWHILPVSTHM